MSSSSPGYINYLIMTALALMWGSSFILIKKGLVAFTPVQLACLRISIASIAFLPVVARHFRRIDWTKWRSILLVGLSGFGGPALLFAIAQTKVGSAMAGILNALTPLSTLLLGIFFFSTALYWRKVAGVLVGLLGAALLILLQEKGALKGNWFFSLLIVVATIGYGLSSNIVAKQLRKFPSIQLSAVSLFLIGPLGLIGLSGTGFLEVMQTHPQAWESLAYVTGLSLGSTVLAAMVFFRLLQATDAVFGSTVAYLIPIVALSWGFLDGERITVFHFLGMALILAGVYLSRKG